SGNRDGKVSARETESGGAMTAGCIAQVCPTAGPATVREPAQPSSVSAEQRVEAAVDRGHRGPHDRLPGIAGHQRRTGQLFDRAAVDEQQYHDGDLAAAERYDGGVLDERPALPLAALGRGQQLVD